MSRKYLSLAGLMVTAVLLVSNVPGYAASKTEDGKIKAVFITPIRFYPDKLGYFYVYETSCVNIAHATQKNLQKKIFIITKT
jgi:signal transduction histidine kinase